VRATCSAPLRLPIIAPGLDSQIRHPLRCGQKAHLNGSKPAAFEDGRGSAEPRLSTAEIYGASISTTQTPSPADIPRQASIRHLPVNLFASVMGVAGLTTAWRQASHQFGTSPLIDTVIGCIAVAIFLLLCIAYSAKVLIHPQAVRNEFRHPVAGNFFGTVTIAILLISSVVAPLSARASEILWSLGAATTIALSFTIVSRLLRGKVDAGHAVPAWLVPGVATLDITVAGGTMPMAWAKEVNLFAMAVGTMVALVFFTMIMAYTNFFQRVDTFAAMLFYFGLFIFFSLVFKVFRRSIPFAAGWWALSFPLAALSNAALRYAEHAHYPAVTALAVGLLSFLSLLIAVLLFRTLHIVFNGKLLSPS
jgi:tellurite resistance protein